MRLEQTDERPWATSCAQWRISDSVSSVRPGYLLAHDNRQRTEENGVMMRRWGPPLKPWREGGREREREGERGRERERERGRERQGERERGRERGEGEREREREERPSHDAEAACSHAFYFGGGEEMSAAVNFLHASECLRLFQVVDGQRRVVSIEESC